MSTDVIWILKLLIDFGLVVLILMVQLIVYPSFKYYVGKDLIRWHRQYKLRLALVVIPLMFSQVILSVLILFENVSTYTVTNGILVLGVWVSTFTQFVPIHNRITNECYEDIDLELLVRRNWLRVLLWIIIFIFSFFQYLSK